MPAAEISIQTLTPERWCDLVDLFGPERGANSGCWCMWPFLRGKDWKALTREERRDAFRNKAMNGPAPGLLAYRGGQAVGWVALGPRENYARFQLSKVTRPLETDSRELIRSTFAFTCFYVRSGHRKAGLMPLLLAAAVDHAGQQGAKVVDACPIDADKPSQWGEGFVGFTPVFRRGGFEEIARRSPRRPLMRRYL